MKGIFSLNIHDICILFGNLGKDSGYKEGYAVAVLDQNDYEEKGKLIAHDVVEHTINHRYSKTVTVEAELRALGAAQFVRAHHGVQIKYDVLHLVRYLDLDCRRPMPPKREVFLTVAEDNWDEIVNELDQDMPEEDQEYWMNWIDAQINYGYWQKDNQYRGDQYEAERDFGLVEKWAAEALEKLDAGHWENMDISGITCNFDTSKYKFTTRYKYF